MFDATDDARSMNGFELCGNGSTSAQYLYEHYWLQTQARRHRWYMARWFLLVGSSWKFPHNGMRTILVQSEAKVIPQDQNAGTALGRTFWSCSKEKILHL